MIRDIRTVMWREWKQQFGRKETLASELVSLVIPVLMMAVMAIYPPLLGGLVWLEAPFSLATSVILPAMIVGMSIVDCFAGERERHTLATLLASRLPDRTILFGKMGAPVLFALTTTLIVHLVSLTTVNVANWDGKILLYSPTIALLNLMFAFLTAMYAASLGVVFSLRAATVQRATQNLLTAVLAPIVILSFGIAGIGTVFPESWRIAFETFFVEVVMKADPTQVVWVITGVLVAVDLGLLAVAMTRFRRSRLILG